MCGWSSVLRHARYPRSLGKVCCIAPCSSNTYPVKSTVLLAWAADSDLDSPVQSSCCHMLLVLWLTEILAKLMNGLDDPGECLEATCWSTMGDRSMYHRSCWIIGVQFQGPNCKSSTSCFAFSFKVCQSEKNDQEKTYEPMIKSI